ncbi:MAG: PAS domain S-box protein, partial [Chloroflexota bacterium]
MARLFSSLRLRLLLLVLLAVLPALGLMLYTNLEQRRLAAAHAQEDALRLTRLMVVEHERLIENVHQLLITLVQLPVIRAGRLADCQALLANLVHLYPAYTNLGAARPDGEIYCSGLPFSGSVNISDRLYFQQAIKIDGFATGEHQIGRITGKPGLNFGYPLHDGAGRIQGVVFAALDLGRLNQLLTQAELPPGSTFTIIDDHGALLARYPHQGIGQPILNSPLIQTILAQKEGATAARGLDGVARLYAFAPLKRDDGANAGVYVSIGLPIEVVFAEADRILGRNLTLLGLVTLAAFIGAWVGSDLFLLKRVRALLGTTERLAAGDLTTRTNVVYGQGELSQLARAFDQMAAALEQREADRTQTEQEIQRRNRELELFNAIIAASASGMEAETILDTACRQLARALDLPRATATLLNTDKTGAVVVAEYQVEGQPVLLNQTIPLISTPSSQTRLTAQSSLVVTEAQSDPRLAPLHEFLRQRGTVSLLALPLIVEGEVVGSLNLEATERRDFSPQEVGLGWSVADQVAGAMARRQLDQQRRLLSIAIEQTADNIILTDTKGTIVYVNPAFEQLSGYDSTEVVGQSVNLLKSGQHDPAFYQKMWTTILAGQVWHGRFVNQQKDGAFYTVDASISPVRDESGAIVNYVSTQRDVTRELQLEEQYHQAQKMEAIGRLTGGIAHDFNNLLTAINGFAELLQLRLPTADPHQHLVANIFKSGQRAAELVSQLMAFSRKQIIEPKVLDLNQAVGTMDRMLQRIIGEDIALKTSLAAGLWPVKVDPAQMEQVIVNLAVNARDAMPQGGQLTIETANAVLDTTYMADHLEAQPGEYVLLAVSDTGIGMTREVQARIFEPFFTTKEPGQGTGLGLATVYGIVKQNGGNIQVYSEAGQGTVFKIYLPRTEETVSALPEPDRTGDLPRGTETILLVEDEPAVRNLAAQVLDEQGYKVLTTADGGEALNLIQAYDEEIHLV